MSPVMKVLCQDAHTETHFETNYMKNRGTTAKDNKHIQQKENTDKSEKINL